MSVRTTLALPLLVAAAGCSAVDDDGGADAVVADSDARPEPADTEVADSDPAPPVDSDLADPDPDPADPDTDTDAAADSDTDMAVDTEPVDTGPAGPPPDFGGGFVDLTAAAWGTGRWYAYPVGPLARPSEAPAALGDLDGDGVPEVVPNEVGDHDRAGAPAWPLARRPDGTWAPDAAHADAIDRWYGKVIGVVDLDGDGVSDLVRSSMDAPIALGEVGVVEPTPVAAGVVGRTGRTNAGVVAALVDVDADGWLDLAMGQDACGSVPAVTVLRRTGLRAWEERVDLVPASPTGGVRVLLPLPQEPGSQAWVAAGWDCGGGASFPAFLRSSGSTADGLPRFVAYDATPADAWFKQTPAGVGGTLNRYAPMGAAVLDLDGDGALELVVTVAEVRQYVYRLDGTPWLQDVTATLGFDFPKRVGTTEEEAWAVAPFDLDLDGRPDLAVAQGDDAVAVDLPLDTRSSFPRVFWRDPAGALRDVSRVLGLDAVRGNWHAALLGDVDGDHDADLLVGGYGFLPRLWRNDTAPAGHPLVVRLRGTTSNHLGVGARVRVEAAGIAPQLRVMGDAASPDVVAAPALYLGLGAAEVARVEVTWPSGLVQVLDDVPAGAVTIEEPPTVSLSEVDRHLPADGLSTVDVVVTPRAADGSPRAATVDVRLALGTGTWAGPAVQDGATWRRTLVAPSTAGFAVLEATIDGIPVRVRPRAWWDEVVP